MILPNWVVIGSGQVFTLVLLVSIFLLIHTSNLKKVIGNLQQKIKALVTDLKQTKKAYNEMQDLISEESSYAELLDEQIEQTRDYHLSLNPDQDIILDLDPSSPMPRQIASLRHAFLISEKEAAISGDDSEKTNWLIIQSKLASIIGFFNSKDSIQTFEEDADPLTDLQDALSNAQQEITDLKDQYGNAQQEAQNYQAELSNIAVAEEDQAKFNNLLERYQATISTFRSDAEAVTAGQANSASGTVELTTETPRDNSEIDALRDLTSDQHNLINQLQQRLRDAQTPEEKTELISDLSKQLEQQKRYLKESESCIELMDNELDQANDKVRSLAAKLAAQSSKTGSARENDMSSQIKKQTDTIKNLKQENEQLVMQLGMGD